LYLKHSFEAAGTGVRVELTIEQLISSLPPTVGFHLNSLAPVTVFGVCILLL